MNISTITSLSIYFHYHSLARDLAAVTSPCKTPSSMYHLLTSCAHTQLSLMFQFMKSVGDSLEAISQYARFFIRLRDAATDVYKLLRPPLQLRDQSRRHATSVCRRGHCAFDNAIIARGSLRKRRPFTHCPSCPRLQDTHVKWISRPLDTLTYGHRRCDQCPCYNA